MSGPGDYFFRRSVGSSASSVVVVGECPQTGGVYTLTVQMPGDTAALASAAYSVRLYELVHVCLFVTFVFLLFVPIPMYINEM